MKRYTLPEMLRVSLAETCLKAKMFAGELSITDFLLKALESPPEEHIIHSIERLKKISALNISEDITPLGVHLAQMPVDCEFGKMILYAIILQCIDPVVAIVSVLSAKEPFILPNGNTGENLNHIKKEFSENSLSDHRMIHNTFEAWLRSTKRDEFCTKNLISNGNMEMIENLRRLIMRHLQMAGYIKNDADRNSLNENSLKWEIVKACLTAGLYREYFPLKIMIETTLNI